MNISIIHPSRHRPEMALETATKWIERAGMPVEYIFSVDNDDPLINKYLIIYDCLPVSIFTDNNKSAIQAINRAATFTTGDILIVVSDDFDCPQNWAIDLLSALDGKSDFIVKTQDGMQPTLITLPIMDRKYYNRFGYVYHPDYVHMFSDQEMTAVGHLLDKVITLPLLFKHNHYLTGVMKRDEINIKNDATWSQGEKLFNERLAFNFGLEDNDIVKNYSEIKWK